MIFDINYANKDTVKITKILDNGGKVVNNLDKDSFIREFIQKYTAKDYTIEENYFPNGIYEYIFNQFSYVYIIETHEYKLEFKTDKDLVLVVKMSLANEFEKAAVYKTEGLIFPAFSRFIKILEIEKRDLKTSSNNIDVIIAALIEKSRVTNETNKDYNLYTYNQIVNI